MEHGELLAALTLAIKMGEQHVANFSMGHQVDYSLVVHTQFLFIYRC